MENILDSFTRQGRKFKQRMKGKKNKSDKAETNTAEENVDSSSSLLRPDPRTATGGYDGEGNRTSTDTRQVHSRDRSPQPESVPVGGGNDDGEGKKVEAGEQEVSQGHSFLEPSFETLVGGGPGPTELGPLSPSPSTPIRT